MQRWIQMIQAHHGQVLRGIVSRWGDRVRDALAESAGASGFGLQSSHGLVIAKTAGRPHLQRGRKIETVGRCGVYRERRMASGRGHRSKDRSVSVGGAAATRSPWAVLQKLIVKPGGATLAEIVDLDPRICGIVANAMVFGVGASPRKIGRARDLARALPNRRRSTFLARILATQSSDRPKPVRRPPLRSGDADFHRGV